MKTKAMKKFLSVLLACMMLVGVLAGLNVFAAEEPTIEIVSNNVWYGETLYPMYAVDATEGYDIVVKVTVDGKEYTCVELYDEELEETVYVAPYGVAAQNINKVYTATAYLYDGEKEVATSASQTYSVLEYLNERLYVSKNVTDDQKTMYNALIDYAAAADVVLNEGENAIDSYYYVYVEGDKTATGMYKEGTVTLSAGREPADGMKIVWKVADLNGNVKETIDDGDEYTVKDYNVFITSEEVKANVKVESELAVFALGANGAAGHVDGTSNTTYSETVNGYTLNITGGTNMYTGARDAKGNSCIKFGTSSKTGSMTFTVPNNVTKVQIYVAGYKVAKNGGTITINDTEYVLNSYSDDGEYDVITIDTSSNKKISFTTVSSGVRCMMNTITFIG